VAHSNKDLKLKVFFSKLFLKLMDCRHITASMHRKKIITLLITGSTYGVRIVYKDSIKPSKL